MASNLRRKYTFKFNGKKVVFVKHREETEAHVLGKAVLYALYQKQYPSLTVEVSVGGKYKPDLVSVDESEKALFWGESGVVSKRKLTYLLRNYPDTHLALLRHSYYIKGFADLVQKELKRNPRPRFAPVEVIGRPKDLAAYIDDKQELTITKYDCTIVKF